MRSLLAFCVVWVQIAAWPTGALADSRLEYSASVTPPRAVLGQKVILTVACRAAGASAQGVSLDDKSLTIELARSSGAGEPRYAFPNRRTIESAGLLIREGETAPALKLLAGERRERSFELHPLFPLELLSVGDLRIGFTLWDGQREIRPNPVALQVRSGPTAVPLLLDRLADGNLAVRERSAVLLHRMTGQGLDYDPSGDLQSRAAVLARWMQWWRGIGQKLPWQNGELGSVRYRVVSPSRVGRDRILEALDAWRRTGAAMDLRGRRWVADADVAYPPGDAVFVDGEIERALQQALAQLEKLAATGMAHPVEAALLLATVARFPATPYASELARIEKYLGADPSWAPVRLTARALLDGFGPATQP